MDYLTIKSIHVATVLASYGMFFVRGIWMIQGSGMLQQRWVRIVPHVNDTVLLVAGLSMAIMIRQYPFVAGWLTAKMIALVVYIALGTVALKRGESKRTRVMAWIGAQCLFVYMAAVALSRNPVPFG